MSLESIADSIKLLATLGGVVVIAYSGLMLIASGDPVAKVQWKEAIAGVLIGLSFIWLAPIVASAFTGGSYCA